MISESTKVWGFTLLVSVLAPFVAGGPLLAGWSVAIKFFFSLLGTIAGMYAARSVFARFDLRTKTGKAAVLGIAAAMTIALILAVDYSRFSLTGLDEYSNADKAMYFSCVALIGLLSRGLIVFAGKAGTLFRN